MHAVLASPVTEGTTAGVPELIDFFLLMHSFMGAGELPMVFNYF